MRTRWWWCRTPRPASSGPSRAKPPAPPCGERFQIHAPFVLSVGDLQPRKNQIGLIRAFARLVRAYPQLKQNLVLAGKETWFADQVHRAARDSGVADRIQFCGFVADEDLLQLYNACDLFVFPSFYEGFGLPALEAMACGRSVVCSHTSALPEVVDGAAILFDPYALDEIAARPGRPPARSRTARAHGTARPAACRAFQLAEDGAAHPGGIPRRAGKIARRQPRVFPKHSPMNLPRFLLCILLSSAPRRRGGPSHWFSLSERNPALHHHVAQRHLAWERPRSARTKVENGGWHFEMNYTAGGAGLSLRRQLSRPRHRGSLLHRAEPPIAHGAKKVTEKTTFDQERQPCRAPHPEPGGRRQERIRHSRLRPRRAHLPVPGAARNGAGQSAPRGKGLLRQRLRCTAAVHRRAWISRWAGRPKPPTTWTSSSRDRPAMSPSRSSYARDAARTPLLFKVPVSLGTLSLELVRR